MSLSTQAVRTVKQRGRRLQGRYQLKGIEGEGIAGSRVIAGVKAAAVARTAEERTWANRIEALRNLMLLSPEPLTITDYGAGKEAALDTGSEPDTQARHTSVRTLSDMTRSSKKPHWARLLFNVVRALQPQTCLEMGACVGISASYQAAALELNGAGRLITLEGAEPLAARTERTVQELGLSHRVSVRLGQFTDTLPGVLSELAPVDYAFIDGHHTEAATLDYLARILPHVSDEAVLVFDDIDWSPGMKNAWAQIAADPRFALTLDLGTIGFAAVSASSTARQTLKVSYG
jgi:predicted O-methyltransferase YrrM